MRGEILTLSAAILSALLPACAQQPKALHVSGDVAGTHDPSLARDGSTWYVYATGKAPGGGEFAIRCSEDLTHWRL